jgi:hypothetical protein|tara:strand:+ start:72 stop:653 length:582 start_codon:yes stop_codon:yes gene_type:complete
MDTIDQFKSLVSSKGGVARANVFRVRLPSLPGVASSRDISLLCKDVQLPGRQILTNERRIGLQFEKVAYGYAIQDINMTFHVMNDYGIKRYFETWQDLAVNQTSLEVGYYNDYTFQIVIDQLKKGVTLPTYSFGNFLDLFTPRTVTVANDQIIYSCQLANAFPTTMNAIQLNNDQDGIVELNVQLSYKNWKQI